MSDETRTMNLIREAADSIIPWLHFTLDLPELHHNLKVPMLDMEVWVDRKEGREDVLMWDFFEKSSSSSRVLQATSAYTWRAKLVCMNMELFRRHRNTSRQVTLERRIEIVNVFVDKLRGSGYGMSTVSKIVEEGSKYYYRKVRIEMEGGPMLNQRLESDLVMSRRRKMGAAETWFVRKRGGAKECWKKENGWRSTQRSGQGQRRQGPAGDAGDDGEHRVGNQGKSRAATHQPQSETPKETGVTERDSGPEATLKVPFTVGSMLRDRVQKVENEYADLLGCRRIRVVEGGGDKIIHLLGRNNPWAAQQMCSDQSCKTCRSRTWIREQEKVARKEKTRPPKIMVKPGSSLCRREGANYTLQCLDCLQAGVDSRYQGETSRSSRQRHQEHVSGLETGAVSNPMVLHSVEQHGG